MMVSWFRFELSVTVETVPARGGGGGGGHASFGVMTKAGMTARLQHGGYSKAWIRCSRVRSRIRRPGSNACLETCSVRRDGPATACHCLLLPCLEV